MMGRLLFVDDDIFMLKALKRSLRTYNFECFYASNGYDAVKIVKENDIEVVLTDMRMPEMDGLKLLKRLDEIKPNLVKVVVSGSTQMQELIQTVNEVDVFKFISKPYDFHCELLPEILNAIEFAKKRAEKVLKEEVLEDKTMQYRDRLMEMKSDINSNDVGFQVLKIYQHIFVRFLSKYKPQGGDLVRSCDCYQAFLDYFYESIDEKQDYVNFDKIQTYFQSVHNVRITIDQATLDECYIEGLGCFVEPILKSYVRDIRLYDDLSVIDIGLIIESSHDKKKVLKISIEVCQPALKAYKTQPNHYVLLQKLIESFGGLVTLKEGVLIIKMILYKV